MKLDKIKKLFKAKQIIALTLSAAMLVTSVPQTAYAAEAATETVETEAADETEAMIETEASETQETQTNAEKTAAVAESTAEEDEQSSIPSETEEMQVTEATTQVATEEGQKQTTEPETVGEADAQEAENQAEGDTTPAEKTYTLEESFDSEEEKAEILKAVEYNGEKAFQDSSYENAPIARSILQSIALKENGEEKGRLSYYDSDNGGYYYNSFTFKWQKDGAAETDAETQPINAGSYQLVIAPKADGQYANAKPLTIKGLTITKAEMEAEVYELIVTPGTPTSDVKKSITYLEVYAENGSGRFTYGSEDKETQLEVTVDKIIDPYTGEKTTDTYLKKNGDYTAEITVAFSDAKDADGNALVSDATKGNYNLPLTVTQKIVIADLKETRTTLSGVTGAAEAERSDNGTKVQVVTKAYDGNAAAVPAYTPKVEEIKFTMDEDGNEKDASVVISNPAIEGKWHSAEFRSWNEPQKTPEKDADGTVKKDENGNIVYKTDADGKFVYEDHLFCSLTVGSELEDGSAPKNAGTYVYRVTYPGDKEQYAASCADIVVEITAVEVTVKPVFADTSAKCYVGETVGDVLKKITWDKNGVQEGIWGTTYDSAGSIQPYEPVFGVYKVEKGEAVQLKNTDKLELKDGVTYEARFTGQKAARREDGSAYVTKEINDASVDSFDSNYRTKTDAETLAANKLELKPEKSSVTIDIAQITNGLKAADRTIDGNTIYTKVYKEGEALYNSRAEYKKATPDGLMYKWYQWNPSTSSELWDVRYDVNKASVEVGKEGSSISFKNGWTELSVNGNDFTTVKSSLSNAGIYKLEITHPATYAQTSVYFAIERQQLRYRPTSGLNARYGMNTEAYIYDTAFNPVLEYNEGNADSWKALDWTEGVDYTTQNVYWEVEAKAPTPPKGENGEDVKPDWEGWQSQYSFDFREGENAEQNEYRLCNDVDITYKKRNSSNYTFYRYDIKKETEKDADGKEIITETAVRENLSVTPITVTKVGEKTLTLKYPEGGVKTKDITYDGKTKVGELVDLSGVKFVDDENKEVTPTWVWRYSQNDSSETVESDTVAAAGYYYVNAKYDGDENYAPAYEEYVAEVTVKRKELTVTVKNPEKEIIAGTSAYEVYREYRDRTKDGNILTVTGFVEGESQEIIDAFTQWKLSGTRDEETNKPQYSYPAWVTYYEDGEETDINLPELVICDSSKNPIQGILESGKEYTLNIDAEDEEDYYLAKFCRNYKITAGEPVKFTPAYAASKIQLSDIQSTDKTTPAADKENKTRFTHAVSLKDGIKYTPMTVTENGKEKIVYGSWATVRITPPSEFEGSIPETAVYKNALENAGAVNVRTGSVGDSWNQTEGIYADFNLSKDGAEGLEPNPVTFSIAWKDGFVESFTITPTADDLEADLRNAVAPKSLAFNAPKTKMVVGEVQDLDVKITKVQNEDLVYLDYKVTEGADVLAVTEQGRITALKEGNATVEVYPVKIADNKKTAIPVPKSTQVKITVSKVAAPKVGKILPADESVDVQYPYVKNNGKYYDYGYRREVYVMAENKKTAENFETAIAKFEETGDWKGAGLAAAPVYVSNDAEKDIADALKKRTEYVYDENISGIASGKNVTIQVKVTGLTPKTPYSVYVRNVSASRTVIDKDGEKRKAELSSNGIPKDFTTTLGQVKKLVVTAEGEAKTAQMYYYDTDNEEGRTRDVPYYEYELTAGKAQLTVNGLFSAVEDGVDKAEVPDLSWADGTGYAVPFADKSLKTKFLEPKLEYRMYQVTEDEAGRWSYSLHDYYNEDDGYWEDGDCYYEGGNAKFLDAALYTKADKKGGLKFTQPEAFAVTAYDTVTKTESSPVIIRVKAEADSAVGAKMTLQVGQKTPIASLVAYKAGKNVLDSENPYFAHTASAAGNDYLETDGSGNITPVKFDKSAAKQTVAITGTPNVSGSAEVTIKDLEPVKNLKFSNLIDNRFTLDFAPSIYAEGYIVDIKNSTGKLVQRKYISQRDEYLDYNDGYIWYYSAAKKAYVWQPGYTDRFEVSGLTAQSKYNVTVTAVYGSAKSKPVTKAVTMTKVPAFDRGISADAMNEGMSIYSFVNGSVDWDDEYINSRVFVSGNRYTLVAGANQGAQYAVTDKLTWSSSDGKVAKISAVGGTYSATLKALKAGTTVIEVKSGILKQTIARWRITVRSVGDAYNDAHFYDENEDLRGDDTDYMYDTKKQLILNIPMTVELPAGGSQTFWFMAEEAGDYKAVTSGNISCVWSYKEMMKGQKQLIRVSANREEPASGTVTIEKVSGTGKEERTPIKLGEAWKPQKDAWGVFTANTDGIYTFKGGSVALYEELDGSYVKNDYEVSYAMTAKQTVYVRSNNDYSQSYQSGITVTRESMASLKAGETVSLSSNDTNKTKWYTFTAEEDGDYRFKAKNNSDIAIYVYTTLENFNKNISAGTTCKVEKGKSVYVSVRPYQEGAQFTVTKIEPVAITDDKAEYPDSALAQETTRYTLKPSADMVYTFNLSSSVYMSLWTDGAEEKALVSDTYEGNTRPSISRSTLSYLLEGGKAYSLKVNNISDSDLTLKVEKKAVNALVLDEAQGKNFTAAQVPQQNSSSSEWIGYLAFTSAEGGTYRFEADNFNGYMNLYVVAQPTGQQYPQKYKAFEQLNASYSNNKNIECLLSAGEKVWLQLGYSSNNSNYTTATIKVTKTGGEPQNFTTDPVTVKAGETAWFTYPITESTRYIFGITGGYLPLSCYEDLNNQTNSSTERYWESGKTAYLKVSNSGSSDVTITLKAEKVTPALWTNPDTAQPVPGNNKETWFAFTAPEEAEYLFTCKTTDTISSNQNVYLYSEKQFRSEKYVSPISGSQVTYPFAKGETVYIRTRSYQEASLKAEKTKFQALQDGKNPIPELADNNSTATVKFTAPETGIYTISRSDSNMSLTLYEDKEKYASGNFSQSVNSNSGAEGICYPLLKGATAYLRVNYYNYSGDERPTEFILTVGREEVQEVKLDDNTVELSEDGTWVCYMAQSSSSSQSSGSWQYISYTSTDDTLSSVGYEYTTSFANSEWKNYPNGRGTLDSNNRGSIWVNDGRLMLIKLTPQQSGTITFKISKDTK